MNQKLQNILDIIQQSEKLDAEQKDNLIKTVKDADKELEITAFKLERTEKVKKTTAILLEETIEELEQKRKAVEEQNRELEIEASLERVRAVAMGMRKPNDLLNICEVLYKELFNLGFDELRNSMINIHNDENKTFLNYDYSDEIGKSVTLLDYNAHLVMEKQINQSRIANDAFSEAVYEGKDLEEWKKFRKKYGEKDDPRIDKIKALYYYFYSIGTGTIGISTFSQINEEKLTLLKRFRNVFNLSYQRYSDIALAEAQAREAQIELGLERVRARAMAMRSSEELREVSLELRKQMGFLGQKDLEVCAIHLYEEDENYFESWGAIRAPGEEGELFQGKAKFPKSGIKIVDEMMQHYKSGDKDYVLMNEGAKGLEWLNIMKEYAPEAYSMIADTVENTPVNELKAFWAVSDFSGGALLMVTYTMPDEDSRNLLRRSANVFDIAYRRFKDLQKAEAQAREAEIQLALERVRARTMAMQKSDDLAETANVLFHQFSELGENPDQLSIGIVNESEKVLEIWLSVQGTQMNRMFKVSVDEPIVINKITMRGKSKRKRW